MTQKKNSDICLIINLFQKAFLELNISLEPQQIEKLALRVHRVMDGRFRQYHGPMHVLDLASDEGPIVALGAIYHDIIQYNIDRGAPPLIEDIINKYIDVKGNEVYLKKSVEKSFSTYFKMITAVFGYNGGDLLPQNRGLNECLSSIVCLHEIGLFLKKNHLIEIICCIEGTVPFRVKGSNGGDYLVEMASRLRKLYEDLNLEITERELDDLIHLVVHLGNKDVRDFAIANPILFIKNTWSILPESNQSLLFPLTVTMKQYRVAFSKMENFLSSLKPSQIFHSYKNIPSFTDLKSLYKATDFNLGFAVKYLRIHLYEISILEAIALETGGMTVLSLFEGDPVSNTERVKRIEDYLPKKRLKIRISKVSIDKEISKALNGRYKDKVLINRFYSPVAACLYNELGDSIVTDLYADCELFLEGSLTAFDYLKKQSREVMIVIIDAISQMAPIRKNLLEELKNKLRKH